MDKRGSLAVLRHGFKFMGQTIRLAYFQPGNNLNPATWALYSNNRLTGSRACTTPTTRSSTTRWWS